MLPPGAGAFIANLAVLCAGAPDTEEIGREMDGEVARLKAERVGVHWVREMVPVLSRAAVAVGVAGLFMETHPDPAHALSDGPNAVPLKHMRALLEQLLALDRVVKRQPLLENDFSC